MTTVCPQYRQVKHLMSTKIVELTFLMISRRLVVNMGNLGNHTYTVSGKSASIFFSDFKKCRTIFKIISPSNIANVSKSIIKCPLHLQGIATKFQPSPELATTISDSFVVSLLTLIPAQLAPLPPPSFTPNSITVIPSTTTYLG